MPPWSSTSTFSPSDSPGLRESANQAARGVLGLAAEVVAVPESPYLMNNMHPETGARFEGLEQALDPDLDHPPGPRSGVPPGAACCLEIGTGGGSIARWLAARVGRTGVM